MAAPAAPGAELFARFAFPPNELGYCGPTGVEPPDLARHAETFDGAWPYLKAIAETVGADPLDEDVVRSYWVGGPVLDEVDADDLLVRLRSAFAGQVTGLLGDLANGRALAHHSFHVFVVYPWVRFLDRDPVTPLKVLQDCRIRWGDVVEVDGDHATILSHPLTFAAGALTLGDARPERVRWRTDRIALAPPPVPGQTVAAHWDWLCGSLTDGDTAALAAATQLTLDVVNEARS